MRAARLLASGALVALPLLVPSRPQATLPPASAAPPPRTWLHNDGCATCHPGAKKALAYTVHGELLARDDTKASACISCHGDQTAHAASAIDPTRPLVRASAVTAAACAVCHPGRGLLPAAGAHPWSSQLDRVPEPAAPAPPADPSAKVIPPKVMHVLEDSAAAGLDFGASARAGYRFVHVFGSRERYDTDLNLDGGFRLTDLELTARSRGAAVFDRATLQLTDLEDPSMRLRGEIASDGAFTAKGRYERDAFKYRARGDFHRVDIRAQEWGFDLALPISPRTDVAASFTRRLQDGFWLTNRVGNRNVTPQTTVAGVRSPRDHDADLYEASLHTRALGPSLRATVEYRDHHDVDSFAYARPAPSNPSAIESEDFTSKSTLHGPGARLDLRDKTGSLDWTVSGRVLDLDRRIRGTGTAQGFDISDFTTTTTAFAQGGAETWIADASATWAVADAVAILGDLRWRDHEEKLRVDQVDVTTYPNLGNSSTVALDLDQRTAQRVLEGSVTLQVEPRPGLRLGAGYGFAREWLRVPDLDTGDRDFVRGRIANDGLLADVQWRPDPHWVFSVRYKAFGQNGIQLHEISDDEVRTVKGKARYQADRWSAEAFTENRQRSNDVSSTELDAWTSGGTVSWQAQAPTQVWASYAFTDLASRTLTNFYFDPDPQPVPQFVGFDGVTHTVSAGLGTDLSQRVRLDLTGAFTSTHGTYDVQVFDWRADVSAQICSSADVGLLLRQADYREDAARSAGLDDYGSYLAFVYVRARVGTARR